MYHWVVSYCSVDNFLYMILPRMVMWLPEELLLTISNRKITLADVRWTKCVIIISIFLEEKLFHSLSFPEQNRKKKKIHTIYVSGVSLFFHGLILKYGCVHVLGHSVVSDFLWPHVLQPVRLLCPWGLSRQEYWSGLPCPSPGDLLNSGIKPRSPALHQILYHLSHQGSGNISLF